MAKKKELNMIREYISQNDIDELLETAFEEQAEAADELELELSDLSEAPMDERDPAGDDQRLISNDDIGALFNNAGAKPSFMDAASSDDSGNLVSQSDIDALLSEDPDVAAPPASENNALKDESEGRVSQGEMDALLGKNPDAAAPRATVNHKLEEDIGGLISQSDIDALLGGEPEAAASSASADHPPEDDIGGLISQSDIDALLGGEPEAAASSASVDHPPEDEIGGLISQSDIDALLGGEPEAAASSASADHPPEDDIGGLISQSDLDALLGGGIKNLPAAGDTFKPQEKNGTRDVISQSDIDALLKGALAPEEEADTRDDGDFDTPSVTQSDIDSLLNESLGGQFSGITAPLPEPVILAEVSEMEEAPMPAASAPSRPWYARKAYRISAMAALLLLISSSLFFMIPRSPDTVSKPVVLVFPIPKLQSQAVTAKEAGDTHIALPGFLVLAPPDNAEITCLTADLVIDLLDMTTVRKIKDNEGFVRNIIYGVINDALLSRSGSAVDQMKLTLAVQAALGHVVPKEMIRAVSFQKFEII